MDSDTQEQGETVYSREFNGTPRLYLRAAIASGLYLGLGTYLVYALIRYYLADDASVFSLEALLCVGIFCALYIPWAYRSILRYDGRRSSGRRSSGRSWRLKEAKVKLIERKQHRRFG